ncbi:hypothetical protein ABIE45_006177, partial [Methylobacterium sp. OAE515]|uniref:hypothetical protein n=1 Tax=Methylobacterium sp. OAE515 TaxID=2817895 RepID=UPI00359E5302
ANVLATSTSDFCNFILQLIPNCASYGRACRKRDHADLHGPLDLSAWLAAPSSLPIRDPRGVCPEAEAGGF